MPASTDQVLVTGGAGYIGAQATHRLCDAGYRVLVIDDLSTGQPQNLPKAATLLTADIGDAALLDDIFSGHSISSVLHFAGSIVVPESVTNPGLYYANNSMNTLTLLRAMARHGTDRLVFSSTAAIYGNPPAEAMPVDETAPTGPISPYGTSKLISEMMIRDMAAAHGLKAVILRYFNVAGADPQGRCGQSTPAATHLIKLAAQRALGKISAMQVFGTDYPTEDGTCIRDYIHVDDLISAHLLALNHLATAPAGEAAVFNCGYGHGFSVTEVLDMMEQVSGQSLERQFASRRAGDAAILVADSRRLRQQLGWQPCHDNLQSIIRSALDWEKTLG